MLRAQHSQLRAAAAQPQRAAVRAYAPAAAHVQAGELQEAAASLEAAVTAAPGVAPADVILDGTAIITTPWTPTPGHPGVFETKPGFDVWQLFLKW